MAQNTDSQTLLSQSSKHPDHEDEAEGLLLPPKEHYRDEPNSPRQPSPPPAYREKRRLSFVNAAFRSLPWLVVILALAWMSSGFYYQVRPFQADVNTLQFDGKEEVEVHHDTLPEKPMPVIVVDQSGQTRWTVSVPSSLEFPLKPLEYGALCSQIHNVSEHLEEHKSKVAHHSYYHVDEKFMDVTEAEDAGLLPTNPVTKWSSTGYSHYDSNDSTSDAAGYCKRSLTFNLETEDAGFGNTLMLLWMAYGLAQKEGRAFFVDDRNWAYGKYQTYFQPVPDQGCLPPPEHRKLPCPHHADHLVVSRGTQGHVFGHGFNEEFEDPRGMQVQRQKRMFAMLRAGYEDLFKLADADEAAVDARVAEIHKQVSSQGGVEVGLHVRHGDNHPWEFAYRNDFIPLARYVEVAWGLAEDAHSDPRGGLNRGAAAAAELYASRMVLASDDPDVLWSQELSRALPAQTRIRLGEDELLEGDKGSEDSSPWQGGFTGAKFWDLGKPAESRRDLDLNGERVLPPQSTLRLRERVGRAYLMDLAVLSHTDRVVCTVSSIGCRLLAVMLGWERAIEQEHWHNVDGEWFWKGIRW